MQMDDNAPYPNELEEIEANGNAARMLVPLVVRESSRGLIQLGTKSSEIITQQKVRLARALGSQVAVAIENARLSAETTAHFEESLIINDLSRAISSTLNLEDMFTVVRDQVPSVTGASELYLALYDMMTDEITFPLAVRSGEEYTIPPRELNTDEVSFIIRQRRPLNLGADYYSPDELRKSLGITNGEGDAQSYLGVPLIAGDEVYGVLAVRDTKRTRAFTINEQRILTTVGSQLGAAIQNARLFRQVSSFADDLERQVAQRTHELEEERDRIDTLYQITSELARTLDMDQLMPRALGMVAKAVGAQDGVIIQLDPITDQLYSRAALNPNSLQQTEASDYPVHPAEAIARWIIMQDEHVLIINDLYNEEYWDVTDPQMAGWHSGLAVLLETNEELLGVMAFLSEKPNAFHESHLRLLVAAANQVASSINNAELYKMIQEQAERLGTLLAAEQEEADKNKAILEGIADGVVLADTSGRIVLFNSAAERILRTPRTEAMGKTLSSVTGVYGASASIWAEALERRLVDPQNDIGEFLDERIALDERTVSVHLSPVYTGDRFLGTVSVFRDITREVEAERSKSEFVANVSHEFRTPLTSIKGYNDLLLMGAFGVLEDKQKDMLATIKDNVTRLASLVEDVLNISKIDSGREQLSIEDVDVNYIIRYVLDNLWSRPQHQTKELAVSFDPNSDLPEIEGDQEKIVTIISNVVDNAFNYTLTGGRIDIKAEVDDKYVLISIADTGIGVPDDFRDKIWRRFERHDETAVTLDVAGTGLGLPIVKELVEMHGGEVWFESEVGSGTTFFIRLPIKQPDYLTTAIRTSE
jgi:PAS domain S-box-containing protein